MPTSPTLFTSPVAWSLVRLLHLYQWTLSPDHGVFRAFFPYGACRYAPTCSEYMEQSIMRYGAVKGMWNGAARLLRCHPWSRGGVDPVV